MSGRFRPDNEAVGEVKNEKSQYLCGFARFVCYGFTPIYTNLTPICADLCAGKASSLRTMRAVY